MPVVIACLVGSGSLHAQPDMELPPATLDAAFADPLVDFDAALTALRVTAWEEGGARMLLLEGDAVVRVGAYGFRGETAVVRLEFEPTDRGRVTHLAAYVEDARSIGGGGSIAAEGGRVLVTAATLGKLTLERPGAFESVDEPPEHPLIPAARERLAAHRAAAAGPGLIIPPGAAEGAMRDEVQLRRQRRRADIAAERQRRDQLQLDPEVRQARRPSSDAPPTTCLTETRRPRHPPPASSRHAGRWSTPWTAGRPGSARTRSP